MGEFRKLCLWGTMVLGSAIVAACGDSPVVPPEEPPLPTSCADPGGVVHEGVFTGASWKASDGPHHLHGAVTGQTLVIEAGALICGAPGAALGVGMLEAEGTADAPIMFTARDQSQPWAGIKATPSAGITGTTITLSHARLEHAIVGVQGTTSSNISVSHSVIRQTEAQGILFGDAGTSSLIGSVVDSACLSMCTSALGYAVVVLSNSSFGDGFHLEDNQILNSGGGGVLVIWRGSGALLGGSIEGSAGIGLFLQEDRGGGRTVRLNDAAPVRITGGSSYPASVPLQAAEMLLATREAQEGWLGNARDTVLVTAHASRADEITIHPGLVWLVSGGGPAPTNRAALIGSLELMAGAVLSLRAPSGVMVERLVSRGTAAAPVEIDSDSGTVQFPTKLWLRAFSGSPLDTSHVAHTRFRGTRVDVGEGLTTLFEDIVVENGDIVIAATGSRLLRARFAGAHENADAALTIAAADVAVSMCDITGSWTDGVRVLVADAVRVNDCNIHGNAGVGLRNLAAATVDARDNWWGDPQGPLGPDGDGVAGNVEFVPFRTQPVDH